MKIFLGFGLKSFPSLLFILSQKVTIQHNCSNVIFLPSLAFLTAHGGKQPGAPFLLLLLAASKRYSESQRQGRRRASSPLLRRGGAARQ